MAYQMTTKRAAKEMGLYTHPEYVQTKGRVQGTTRTPRRGGARGSSRYEAGSYRMRRASLQHP